MRLTPIFSFFFFNDTATTEIYTLSLHDALPISISDHLLCHAQVFGQSPSAIAHTRTRHVGHGTASSTRSEEHTSELQSRLHLVCRLLLEKKKTVHTEPL